MRIALIHALRHSPPPIEAAFARLWPEAVLMNLLDDQPLRRPRARRRADAADDRALPDPRALRRRHRRGRHPLHLLGLRPLHRGRRARARADARAEAERGDDRGGCGGRRHDRPARHLRPTLDTMPPEFPPGVRAGAEARRGRACRARPRRCRRARPPGRRGGARSRGCDAIALAQFSLSSAAPAVAAATGRLVLTTPDSAVRKLRRALGAYTKRLIR